MQLESIKITDTMILREGKFLLVSVSPLFKIGGSEERIGTTVVVALTGHKYEKITVKITDQPACKPFNTPTVKEVSFDNFVGTFTQDAEGVFGIKATADSFMLISY